MSMHRFFEALKARWGWMLCIWLLVIALTAIVSVVLPQQFTATASVLVDLKNPDPLVQGVQQNNPLGAGYMSTQTEVVASQRVANKVIQSLGLAKSPQHRELWLKATDGVGEFEPWLAEYLQKKLEVLPTRESGVMWVSFTAREPREAADIANAFVQAYIATTLELRVDPARQYGSYFDGRAKLLSQALEAAQNKLSNYQRERGILVTDERLDIATARLTELSTQIVAAQSAAADSSSRQRQADRDGGKLAEVLNSPAVSVPSAELARQEIRLGELRQRLREDNPEVRDLKETIALLRAQVATETRRASATIGVSNQINEERVARLSALLEEQRAKVLQLKSQRDGASVLLRDVENAQRAYDAVQARAGQTTLESQNTQTNVSVLKLASAPVFPSSPKLGVNLAVAAVLGMLLALGMLMFREMTDRRLRTEEDVLDVLKLPLLVTLPRGIAPARAASKGARRVKARVLGLRAR
jgi:polysaccharide biosynthesis transport protein